jgi:hypothetical protein
MRTTSAADPDDLPEPIEDPRRMQPVDRSTIDAARTAVGAVTRYVATGTLRGVGVTETVRELHRWATRVLPDDRKYIDSQHATIDSTAESRQDDLRVVAAEGGHLAVAVRPLRVTSYPRDELEVGWQPAFRTVHGRFGQSLYRDFNLCLVVFLPEDGGTPRTVAASALPAPV